MWVQAVSERGGSEGVCSFLGCRSRVGRMRTVLEEGKWPPVPEQGRSAVVPWPEAVLLAGVC